MIVPDFWAEGRAQFRGPGRQVTLRRFGWSDLSMEDAQANADARAQDALARVLAGERLNRCDAKVAYGGGQGIPIREEVLERHGRTVVTRNSYGARCLNSPDVLFADIDLPESRPPVWLSRLGWCVVLVLAAAAAWWLRSGWSVLAVVLILYLGGSLIPVLLRPFAPPPALLAPACEQRVRDFSVSHPDWSLRLYRSPAGFRVVVTHRCFEPSEQQVQACFEALGADPVYVWMCRSQNCFRARLSAKPWRIGIRDHLAPRPGVWPLRPERLPARREWVARYETAAGGFAACRWIATLGTGIVHPDVAQTLQLHDQSSGALVPLPLA